MQSSRVDQRSVQRARQGRKRPREEILSSPVNTLQASLVRRAISHANLTDGKRTGDKTKRQRQSLLSGEQTHVRMHVPWYLFIFISTVLKIFITHFIVTCKIRIIITIHTAYADFTVVICGLTLLIEKLRLDPLAVSCVLQCS